MWTYEGISNARLKTPDVLSAVTLLGSDDRATLAYQLAEPHAIGRPLKS
jgi:hypothetical protein